MTTLAEDSPLTVVTGDFNSIGIIADDIVYEGAMVGENASGYGRPLVAGDLFVGHSLVKVDNTGGLAGAKEIRLRTGRYRGKTTITGVLITDVGKEVYASDDDTYTLSGTDNSHVGVVIRYDSSNTAIVEFETRDAGEKVYTKAISITAAEIKALAATQKELIPAPGADYFIEVLGLTFILDYGSEVLAEPSAPDDLEVVYDTAGGTSIADVIGDWVIQGNDSITCPVIKNLAEVNANTTLNKAVVLDNNGAEYTGNASDDTVITVISTYKIHKVGLA